MALVIIRIISYLSLLLCPIIAISGLSLPIFFILIAICGIILNYKTIHLKSLLSNYTLWLFPILILVFCYLAPTSVLPFTLAIKIFTLYFLGAGLIFLFPFDYQQIRPAVGQLDISQAQEKKSIDYQLLFSFLSYGYLVAIFLLLLIQIIPADILSSLGQKLYKSDFNADHYLTLKINRQLCLFALLYVLITSFFYKSGRKYWAIITYFITLIIIFISQSETAKLVFLITNIVFILVYFSNAKLRYILIISYFIGNIIAISIIPNLNIQKIAETTSLQHSALHRLCIWQYTIDLIKKKPFGYGFNSSSDSVFVDIDDKDVCVTKNIKTKHTLEVIKYHISWHPHYNILQILLELGVIGLLLLGFILFKTAYFLNRNFTKKLPMAISYSIMLGYLAIGTTGYDIWQGWYFSSLFLLAFYTLILINTLEKRRHI